MKFSASVLIVLCFNISPAFSQTSLFSFNKYINDKGDTLNYRQLYPDADPLRKYPLVIFLHGSGERGSDNEAQLKWGVNNFATDQNMKMHPAFVIAPQCPATLGWANFSRKENSTEMHLQPAASKTMELVIALIQQVIKTLPIDTNRIYITGLSMGGFGTYDAIERYPNLFAAAVPVCGGGDISKATSIARLPLTKAGAHPGFTQYPEVGHFSWIGAYSDPLMMEWLFRQHK
jgi:predicted peptidase